ncbi:hypothetical protein BS17DRAFT_784504 [Gyrodon lividus]|nr:hypothetical protein BS17DRAFT_784504 [Gyrodon lividus]
MKGPETHNMHDARWIPWALTGKPEVLGAVNFLGSCAAVQGWKGTTEGDDQEPFSSSHLAHSPNHDAREGPDALHVKHVYRNSPEWS